MSEPISNKELAEGIFRFFENRMGFEDWWMHIEKPIQKEIRQELIKFLDKWNGKRTIK